MTPKAVSSHVVTAGGGVAISAGVVHWAWMIAVFALAISLGFALLRFIPREEK
jgi:hypothetical protein